MQALLAAGENVNATSERGQTALMLAAVFGREEVAKLLLAAGADVTLKDHLGLTAGEWSERRGFSNIARLISGTPPSPSRAILSPETRDDRDVQPYDVESENDSVPLRTQSATAAPKGSGLLTVLRARAAQARAEDQPRKFNTLPESIPPPDLKPQEKEEPWPEVNLTSNSAREVEGDEVTAETQPVSIEKLAAFEEERPVSDRSASAYRATGPLNLTSASIPQPPTHHPARPVLWILVAATFLGAAYVTFRLTSHPSVTAPAAPAVVVKSEPPRLPPPKPAPLVSGALAGAELSVPDASAVDKKGSSISGTVTVSVRVNKKGKVVSTKVLTGERLFRNAAVKAARVATFDPDKLVGKRKVVTGTITYDFAARETVAPAPRSSPAVSPNSSAPPVESGKEDVPVTGGELAGAERNLPRAEYPSSARKKGIAGAITVTVRVDRTGRVISWLTSKGDYQLRMAALKAAKKSTFQPDKLGGKREVVGTITYNFRD